MRWVLAAILVATFVAPAAAQGGSTLAACSRDEGAGERTLCHELVVPASGAEVWRLLSTSDGWRSWAAPVAEIELRSGGRLETSYDRSAQIGDPGNIRSRVIAVAPERLLVIQIADAPPGFPHEALARELTTAIELEPVDPAHTRVRVTMMGYRDAPGFETLYAFFDRGNAATLMALRQHIEQAEP